jgi:hypothetical protein
MAKKKVDANLTADDIDWAKVLEFIHENAALVINAGPEKREELAAMYRRKSMTLPEMLAITLTWGLEEKLRAGEFRKD